MILAHQLLPVDQLSAETVGRMYQLMTQYYGNVQREIFLRDLARKQGVLLVYDQHQVVCGFTTYTFFETEFRGCQMSVLYSGDTVIEESYWGSLRTTRLFVALLNDCLQQTEHDVYWFLLSKGTRTYQLLPLYFRMFYPHYAANTPDFEQALIDYLCELQFGERYHPESGIIRFGIDGDYLREDYDQELKSSDRRHAEFFLQRNPGYRHGDNLPCVARISSDNFQPIVLKWIKTIDDYEISQVHS